MASFPHNFTTQHNTRIFIGGFPQVLFTELTGGTEQTEQTVTHPGAGGQVNVPGATTVEQITLRKQYDPATDNALIAALRALRAAGGKTSAHQQHTNAAGVPVSTTNFLRCGVASIKKPDGRRGSGEVKMLEIVLAPEEID